ncbi:MAG: M3 family oligoendopeptidase, partial [Gemmatimonadales bacterium]
AYTVRTDDPAREAAHLRFSADILPQLEEQDVRLARRLLDLGYRRDDLDLMLRRFRTHIEIFREENVPLFSELEELGTRYQKITGGMTAEWEGRVLPLPQLQPKLRDLDRDVRERAYRAITRPYMRTRQQMAQIFDRMYELRQKIAAHAGFLNFRDYSFTSKCRFAYTPADVERFHDAVEAVVVPAVARLYARRREQLGIDRLRPWDTAVDPLGRPALKPFSSGTELMNGARKVFERLDPVLGREFGVLVDEDLLDLDARTGKAPGGYCETLHARGRPFIFMNAAGTLDDIMTLTHESGHAFHAFASHELPLIWQRHPGMEAAELASMSMEILASGNFREDRGGFFTDEQWARARGEHLEDILLSLTHIAAVDAFQTWIYVSGSGGEAEARDRAWLDIRSRFERGLDWSGLEEERVARWYRQLHIFLYPFYYIEYGIAQLGALQVWRNSLNDPAGALHQYREALALGATRPLAEIYAAAGAELIFDSERIAELVALVEDQLQE